ncbi:hypothetical protein [Pseudoalteromonas aliena]|uniref:hypothetical protein n=1 Tax=Pseudoalteromonas aliena TaxID=247523 RepID=UPI0024943176|nr:hypothetical protein [Pseudoalteromonas aliena]
MKFDMAITDNFASFYDEQEGSHIFIDSFDNEKFEMRIGSLDNSKSVGSVIVFNDDELNIKLLALYIKYINTLKLNEV